jgi:PAS domain S-box-containing protein
MILWSGKPLSSDFETLWNDGEFRLSRSAKSGASCPVLVLTSAVDQPAPSSSARLEHAYDLRSELDPSWAARPLELIHDHGKPALLIEDHGGEVLARLLGKPWELDLFLRVAIGITSALGRLHQRGLFHRDIKPANVFVNTSTGEAWLSGFGLASRLPRERQTPEPPETIAGTLAYMAPEQTGRANRSIDSRSDLYSLGVTLYQLLTGSLPFTASDPMEWVHCHIARRPVPPSERLANVPIAVSQVIMRLLAKTAEERYQTATGLESDLRRCLAEWEAHRHVMEFPLGQHDTPDRLLIPEKLYGREREVDALLAAFDRVVKGGAPELVLVSGYSGIGKSSVVNELHLVVAPPRGLFASGKFDQYKRDIPYSTLVQAFQSLVRPLLGKSDAELAIWRSVFLEALELNARLMTDLIPELKLIIGEQAPVPELEPQQAQSRFHLVFRRFIGVFARPEHPLALFLDDLQWLDAATLDLLEDLLTRSDLRHLMLIGAYRDNEVDAAHPLTRKLEAIRQAGARVQEVRLAPLARDDLGQLIADALRCDPAEAAPLVQLVHKKTAGNPFFVIQFLYPLAEEGLLRFDQDAAGWSWDLGRIRDKDYTDNVVDLMQGKVTRLPAETQHALQQFACLGSVGATRMLSAVLETSEEQVHAVLWPAVRQELIERLEGSYKFIHDRVQEAAYSLIPEALRAEVHLRIGRLLVTETPADKREEAIFEILNQLNRGASMITQPEEREQLAELNLLGGKRAKGATAYASALTYLIAGGALLKDDCWERRRELIFALELNRAECEFLTGQLSVAEERLAALSNRATTIVESAIVACLRMDVSTTLNLSGRAVAFCLDYLRHIGIEWSPHPTEEEMRREYERIWSLLGNRTIEDLIDLPLMEDPASLATVDVLIKVLPPAKQTDESLASLTICKAVSLSIEHGNCDASCVAYEWLARIAGPHFGDYKAGFRFGHLGFELVERRGLKRYQASTHHCFAIFVVRWTKHVRACIDLLRRTFELANRIGDLTYAAYVCHNLNSDLLFAGETLPQVQAEAKHGLAFAEKMRFGLVIDIITTQLALVRTLRGCTPKFGCFDDAQFNESCIEFDLSSGQRLATIACRYWIRKMQARYIASDYATAIDAASKAQPLLWTVSALFEEAEYHFYGALAQAACCDSAPPGERLQYLNAVAEHHKQLQVWAENCPENFENRAALVGAEIARIEGRVLDAEQLYEQAMHSAQANGFVQNEALTAELAARFYAARGFEDIAHLYLRKARYGYLRWGADGKVRQLEEMYPHLRAEEPAPGPTSTIATPVEHLDLATVIKVSQAVSSEIVLEKLIHTLMRTAIEQAGAERGLLILPRGVEERIEAEATTSGDDVIVHLRDASVTAAPLPESLVRYVMRTHENVILEDASARNAFSADAYIAQHRARSILCLPLINQTKLIGVLYLENNLTPNVFAPARITVLKVLVSQAATALENTKLYRDLADREAKIRQSEKELRQLLDFTPQHVTLLGPDRSRLYNNQAALDYHGLTLKEWQTADPDRLFHPQDSERITREVYSKFLSGSSLDIEVRLRRRDGQYRWFLIRYNPTLDEQGHPTHWYAAATDIEDHKQAEQRLQDENVALREEIDRASMFDEIVGISPTLHAVLFRVSKVAPTDSTVLITGETGTGKELVARAIHRRSHRSSRAFVSVNCAAVPRDLIASELFGHEKGAFTGATQRRLGRFELAEGGTIFLDEVGELPAETQIALLRVLQEHEFERVGGTGSIRTNVRVIAATNRDLEAAIAAGTFRSDLFYRLNVFPIEVPPLRARQEDIPLLVEYFIARYASKAGKSIRRVNKKSLRLLQSYPWPGNIRELQNVIERSVIVCDTDNFSVDESWLSRQPPASEPKTELELLRKPAAKEREIIEAALRESGGRVYGVSGAASKLGIPRSTLESKIRSLKINKSRFKATDSSKNS